MKRRSRGHEWKVLKQETRSSFCMVMHLVALYILEEGVIGQMRSGSNEIRLF